VLVGYYAQAHEGLNLRRTVLEEILEARPMNEGEARSFLARFLFTEEEVFKRIGELSGGERSRVALACLTLRPTNVLLLDEPTNHLDIPARQVLEEVLRAYPGTVLMASHDRYFISAVADQIWAIEEGVVRMYQGRYEEYLTLREQGRYQPEGPERIPSSPQQEQGIAAARPAKSKKTSQGTRDRAPRSEPPMHWPEPIADLIAHVVDLEQDTLAYTERLAYPAARPLDELVALAQTQQSRQSDLTTAVEDLLAAVRQELRRDPFAQG